ncbi:TPA: hypothetical protein ACX96Z_000123 [Clostridium sporogenes]
MKESVIAFSTSVGYRVNLGGLSALLVMSNNCASGVSVANFVLIMENLVCQNICMERL